MVARDTNLEIGSLYFAKQPGDFLVWDVRPADNRLDVYICGTGDLGRVPLDWFRFGLQRGTIRLAAHISDVVQCPLCKGGLTIVQHGGRVDHRSAPFIACMSCAFCEDLFEGRSTTALSLSASRWSLWTKRL